MPQIFDVIVQFINVPFFGPPGLLEVSHSRYSEAMGQLKAIGSYRVLRSTVVQYPGQVLHGAGRDLGFEESSGTHRSERRHSAHVSHFTLEQAETI